MSFSDQNSERKLKITLNALEAKWNKALQIKDERKQLKTLDSLRFQVKKIIDNYRSLWLNEKEDGNKKLYSKLLGRTKRWAYLMEGRLK